MKETSLYAGAILGTTLILLLAQPPSVQGNRSTQEIDDEWVRNIYKLLEVVRKRGGCFGYMCSYHHMGNNAASRSRQNFINSDVMHDCLSDPACSPGKRRRRSTLLNRLSRSASTRRDATLRDFVPSAYSETLKRRSKRDSAKLFATQ